MSVVQFQGRPSVPISSSDQKQHLEQIARAARQVMRGQINCTLELTLDASVATTPIIDSRISIQTHIGFMPTTADAATELASGNLYCVPANGTAVVHHTNSANTTRVFHISLLG